MQLQKRFLYHPLFFFVLFDVRLMPGPTNGPFVWTTIMSPFSFYIIEDVFHMRVFGVIKVHSGIQPFSYLTLKRQTGRYTFKSDREQEESHVHIFTAELPQPVF